MDDHQITEHRQERSDIGRLAHEALRLRAGLTAWRADVDAAHLDHGWIIIERIDALLGDGQTEALECEWCHRAGIKLDTIERHQCSDRVDCQRVLHERNMRALGHRS